MTLRFLPDGHPIYSVAAPTLAQLRAAQDSLLDLAYAHAAEFLEHACDHAGVTLRLGEYVQDQTVTELAAASREAGTARVFMGAAEGPHGWRSRAGSGVRPLRLGAVEEHRGVVDVPEAGSPCG